MGKRRTPKRKSTTTAYYGYGFFLSLATFFTALYLSVGTVEGEGRSFQQSVVKLRAKAEGGAGGTGFIVSGPTKNYTVTNWHVCQAGTDSMYAFRTGEFESVKLNKIAEDAKNDICLLQAAPGIPLTLGDAAIRYSELFVMGHPLLMELTPVNGHFIGEIKEDMPMPMPESGGCPQGFTQDVSFFGAICRVEMTLGSTTLQIFPGNSGSPVVDVNTRVVGIMQSLDNRTGWGGFVPVRFLKALLEAQR